MIAAPQTICNSNPGTDPMDTEGGRAAWSARMMMKKLLSVALLLLLLVSFCVPALAANDPLKISMELSATRFSGPREITVSIKVSNSGEGDMPGPVTLYYPNGKQVTEFGSPTLNVGSSKSWNGTWKVTQAQLDAGRITFKVKYSTYNDEGELVSKTKNFSRAISYTGTVANVEINRTISPANAKEGQEVTVTYDVVNAGNVDVTNLSITEHKNISSKKGTIDTVPAGGKASYTFTATMGKKDLTSQATITYKINNKTYTAKKEATTIKYSDVKLDASLAANKKGGNVGETVVLTLTLKNTGKTDFSSITVTDPLLGEVFTGQSVEAGKTLKLEKEVPITQTADYAFTVKGVSADGLEVETATKRLSVTALDPAMAITLEVNAHADRSTVYTLPGNVKFTVQVTNTSAVDVNDVYVYAVDTQLYHFPVILAGETREFVRDVSVSMAGQYAFNARCKNQLSETVRFQSNIVPVSYAAPTPVPTQAPIVTVPPPVFKDMPTQADIPASTQTLQTTLWWVSMVLFGLAIGCFILFVVGLVFFLKNKKASDAAMDHLDTSSYRQYSIPVPVSRRRVMDSEPLEDEDNAGGAEEEYLDTEYPEDTDVMMEQLSRIYGENGAPAAPAAEDFWAPAEEIKRAPVRMEVVEEPTEETVPTRRRRGQR